MVDGGLPTAEQTAAYFRLLEGHDSMIGRVWYQGFWHLFWVAPNGHIFHQHSTTKVEDMHVVYGIGELCNPALGVTAMLNSTSGALEVRAIVAGSGGRVLSLGFDGRGWGASAAGT